MAFTALRKERERMGRKPQISQCMIVKNEEKNIQRALNWGKSMMWEQIVVDTGSNDHTVELAKAMGARVCYFPWIDDFAAAKNYAISQAKGDWIVFLDADEYMLPGGEQKLYQIIRQAGDTFDALSTGWMQMGDGGEVALAGTQIRIFRNLPGMGYRRRIHEQLGFLDGRPMRICDAGSELAICHTGYCGEEFVVKKSSGRNRRLIEMELTDHPDDYEMMGYMGDDYFSQGDHERAGLWYERAIAGMPEMIPENDQRSAATYTRLMLILKGQDDGYGAQERLLELYLSGVNKIPKEADFDYISGCYFAERQDYKKGSQYLLQALKKVEQYGYTNRSMILAANLEQAYENLVSCFYHSRCLEQTVETATVLLKSYPYNMKGLYLLLKAFRRYEVDRQVNNTAMLIDFLGKLYDFTVLKDNVFVLRVAREAGYEELVSSMEYLLGEVEWN